MAPTSAAGGRAIRVLVGGEHNGDVGVPRLSEIGVLRHVLFFVGGDGPDSEVVDLLVDVVADRTGVVRPCGLRMRIASRSRSVALPLASMVSTYSSYRMTADASFA